MKITEETLDRLAGVSHEYRAKRNSKLLVRSGSEISHYIRIMQQQCEKSNSTQLQLVIVCEVVHILKAYDIFDTYKDQLRRIVTNDLGLNLSKASELLSLSYKDWRAYIDFVRSIATGLSKTEREIYSKVVNDYVKARFQFADFSRITWLEK